VTHPRYPREHGFSLVELMVALTVGLLLLAGVLQILMANREGSKAQSGTAHLEENARLAIFVLEHAVSHAGYYVSLDSAVFKPSGALQPDLPANAVVGGINNENAGNDQLRVRFESAGGVHNCRGADVGSGNQPRLADFEFYVSDTDSLLCHQAGSDRQPIVDNVDRFKVRYGVGGPNRGDGVRYYTSEPTTAALSRIKSVRIQLLLRADTADGDRALPEPIDQHYEFMDGSSFDVTDRRQRLLIDRTIALKNRLP